MSTRWQIAEVPTPPSAGVPDAWPWRWAYAGYSAIQRAIELETWGHHDRWAPTFILMTFLGDSPWRRSRVLVATAEDGGPDGDPEVPGDTGAVLGVAQITLPLQDDDRTAFVGVAVRPGCRGQGIGGALAAAVGDVLRAEGRTTVIASAMQSPEPEPGPGVVTAPTGSGRVSLETPDATFATSRGFVLEQVARVSQLDVPEAGSPGVVDVERLLKEAAEHAGPDYRTHVWNRTVPEEWLGRLAVPWGRMSTDAPHADLDTFEETWDADRVAAMLKQQAEAHQQTLLTAVEHVPTGDLVAFTWLSLPDFEEVDFGFQGDTLVLSEHRGRRLGMLAKATNLLAMVEDRPRIRRIHTINAEENSFMLAINVALGFRGVGVLPTWQRHD